jgi:hypothetical protein
MRNSSYLKRSSCPGYWASADRGLSRQGQARATYAGAGNDSRTAGIQMPLILAKLAGAACPGALVAWLIIRTQSAYQTRDFSGQASAASTSQPRNAPSVGQYPAPGTVRI